FDAFGQGITWAIMDTGIEAAHPQFAQYSKVSTATSRDFSDPDNPKSANPLKDSNGHGTHVAGIIAGVMKTDSSGLPSVSERFEEGMRITQLSGYPAGIAPKCQLVSIKVLDDTGQGDASSAILALEYLRSLNSAGKEIKIDGVNLSLGYPFDPKWYGCGHSPLCEEVRRTVDSGIVVVVSAGNSGYGTIKIEDGQAAPVYLELSINDPGNTEAAITVGSVHKSRPHTYGISYFSSKGPTGDGRMKPDLVAPGEKILSCAAGAARAEVVADMPSAKFDYLEQSGTSMAAPHVSGVAAAFLSVRREFIGQPEKVKGVFLATATDLKRDRYFQGSGLVDLMRAIQSV